MANIQTQPISIPLSHSRILISINFVLSILFARFCPDKVFEGQYSREKICVSDSRSGCSSSYVSIAFAFTVHIMHGRYNHSLYLSHTHVQFILVSIFCFFYLLGSIQTEGHTSLKGFLNSALKKSFVLLIFDLVAILTKESEALLRITTALEHAPDVLFDTKCIEEAKSVADVFRYLRQFWSHTECELLSFVVEASCCEAATARLQEFLSFREENAEHIIIHPSQPSPPSPGAQTPPPSEHTPPHRAPTTPPFKQAPPTSPHEASASDRVEHPRIAIIVASVDTDVLTQKDYNAISDAIRSVLSLQKHVLVFDGTEEGDTEDGSNQLKWRVNADSIQIDQVSDSHLKELQEQHVNGLTSTVGKNAYEFINSKA